MPHPHLRRPASAQYFGRNKLRYKDFDFQVLETEHFDIYFYPREREGVDIAARMAERWHARLGDCSSTTCAAGRPLVLGPVPVEVALFTDGGVAWNNGEKPAVPGRSRDGVASAGVTPRGNILGFAVGEFDFAHPFQRPSGGWVFQFNLSFGSEAAPGQLPSRPETCYPSIRLHG